MFDTVADTCKYVRVFSIFETLYFVAVCFRFVFVLGLFEFFIVSVIRLENT